jgi:hypothetical protein
MPGLLGYVLFRNGRYPEPVNIEALMVVRRLLLAVVMTISMSATPALASRPIVLPITVGINFAENFMVVACPGGAPATAFCLNIKGTADVVGLGRATFQRSVLIPNKNLYDPNDPTCIPEETSGTLALSNGTLTFHAPGDICLLDKTVSYELIVTAGTGAYKGVIGGGQITVLPPETASTGREVWRLDLFPPSSAE